MRASALTDLPLVQLVGGSDPAKRAAQTSTSFLAEVAEYADGIGAPKYGYVIQGEEGLPDATLGVTPFVDAAHAAGLFVHVYTFRAENPFLPPAFQRAGEPHGNLLGEMLLLLSAGLSQVSTGFRVKESLLFVGIAACVLVDFMTYGAAMAGLTRGRTTNQKIRHSATPSIRALSIRSKGSALMKFRMNSVQNPVWKAAWKRNWPAMVS